MVAVIDLLRSNGGCREREREREREKEREQKVEARGWQNEKEGKARAKGRVARHDAAAGRVRRKSAATVAPSSTHPV